MKKLFTLLALFVVLSASAQKNYNLDEKKPKTEAQLIGKADKTQNTATYQGKQHAVYTSPNGKLFIVYLNRKGNWSKKYIPAE